MQVAIYPAALMVLTLGLALLIATNKTYQYTFGTLLSYIADNIRKLPSFSHLGLHISFDGIAGLFDSVNNFVLRKLGEGIAHLEQAVLGVWHNMIATIVALGDAIAEVAESTEKTLDYLRRWGVTKAIHAATHWIVKALQTTYHRLTTLEYDVARILAHPIRAIKHEVQTLQPQITQVFKFVTVGAPAAVAKAVAIPWGAIHGIERKEAALGKRVKALEKVAGVAAVGVVASVALGKLGLGWTRCSNVGRVGKALCGFNRSILDTLLVDSLVVFSSISLVEFASVLVTITEGLASTVTDGFRETRGMKPLKFTGYTGKLG